MSPESIPCRPVDEPCVRSHAILLAARSRAEWVGDPVPSLSMARLRTDLGSVREMARCVALESGMNGERFVDVPAFPARSWAGEEELASKLNRPEPRLKGDIASKPPALSWSARATIKSFASRGRRGRRVCTDAHVYHMYMMYMCM